MVADQIICAVGFFLTDQSALILWLGVSSKKFDDTFGKKAGADNALTFEKKGDWELFCWFVFSNIFWYEVAKIN